MEAAIRYHVVEADEQGLALRELRLDYTTPANFKTVEDL
jgi:hypothetical protein